MPHAGENHPTGWGGSGPGVRTASLTSHSWVFKRLFSLSHWACTSVYTSPNCAGRDLQTDTGEAGELVCY